MSILDLFGLKRHKKTKPINTLQDLLDNPESFKLIGGGSRSRMIEVLKEIDDATSNYLVALLSPDFKFIGDYLVFEYLPNLGSEGKMSFDILRDYCFTNWDGNTDIEIRREAPDGNFGYGTYRYVDFYVDGVKVRYIFRINLHRHEFILITETLIHNAEIWAMKNLNRFGLRRIILEKLDSVPGI